MSFPSKTPRELGSQRTNYKAREFSIEKQKGLMTMLPNQTIHKAVAAFIVSLITLLGAFEVVVPWLTPALADQIGWGVAFVFSLFGSGLTGFFTWLIPNKAK